MPKHHRTNFELNTNLQQPRNAPNSSPHPCFEPAAGKSQRELRKGVDSRPRPAVEGHRGKERQLEFIRPFKRVGFRPKATLLPDKSYDSVGGGGVMARAARCESGPRVTDFSPLDFGLESVCRVA